MFLHARRPRLKKSTAFFLGRCLFSAKQGEKHKKVAFKQRACWAAPK